MPRELIIGNGRLLINLDGKLNIRDLYYPHVGLFNHVGGHPCRVGVWADGDFSWTDEPGWEITSGYLSNTLVTDVHAFHPGLALEFFVHDTVHFHHNLYLKKVTVKNNSDRPREIRMFFHLDLSVDQSDIGDTALYDLESEAVIHYKRNRCFLISGQAGTERIFQFATGVKRFGGAEGTWRDAEDGWLEGHPITQGSVDSTISFRLDLGSGREGDINYWIAVGENFEEVWDLNSVVLTTGFQTLLNETRVYWQSWVNKEHLDFRGLSGRVIEHFIRSLLIIRTQVDREGAIIASNDSSILQFGRDHYSYVWPRDGALVAYALDKAGFSEVTRPFYLFCRNALSPSGFLWHKYNPDGSVGSSWHPWVRERKTQLPIQEDETALVLIALWNYFEQQEDLEFVRDCYDSLVRPAADFLVAYRHPDTKLPQQSYDLWEERRGVFTFTVASVYGALRAAANFARLFGQFQTERLYLEAAAEVKAAMLRYLWKEDLNRFLRGLYYKFDGTYLEDSTVESSLFAVFAFGVLPPDDPRVVATMTAIKEKLWVKTAVGGIARYAGDWYCRKGEDWDLVPGNPWVICTLWVALWHIATAKTKKELRKALPYINWAVDHALPSGIFPEQVNPYTGGPESVAPLTWSHSTLVQAVVEYTKKRRELDEKAALALMWHGTA